LAGSPLACVTSAAAAIFIGGAFEAQQEALRQDIATRRAALVGGRGTEAEQALAVLDEKKQATPPDVIVIETLSKTLPDSLPDRIANRGQQASDRRPRWGRAGAHSAHGAVAIFHARPVHGANDERCE
jgi:hypothetical protein